MDLAERYGDWLAVSQGLAPGTVSAYTADARAFIAHRLPEIAELFELPEPTEAPLHPDLLAHRHSVARSDDPHADSKLSSARGLRQEREQRTLASGRPGSRRPLSGGR